MLVPADATNSARQATTIAGDGRRSLRFMVFSLSRRPQKSTAWGNTDAKRNLIHSRNVVNARLWAGQNSGFARAIEFAAPAVVAVGRRRQNGRPPTAERTPITRCLERELARSGALSRLSEEKWRSPNHHRL